MSGDEDQTRGFTIVDKRGREEPETEAAADSAPESGRDAPGTEAGEAAHAAGALPRVDFASFALSLGTSALYHLGLVKDPETGQPGQLNLPVARHTIDTLELLEEKTRGNLTSEEQQLLSNLLTELRMRFVEASR